MAETRGSSEEYREAMTELCGIQQAFIYYIVLSSMEIIAKFLEQTKEYRRQLEASGNNLGGVSGSWCKVGWALYKKEELRSLRDSLHCRLVSVNTLFAAAKHTHALPTSVSKFQDSDNEECEPSKGQFESADALPDGTKTGRSAHKLGKSEREKVEREVQERLDAARGKWEAEQAAATQEWKKAIEVQAMDEARAKLEMQRQADERAIAAEEERKKAEVEFRERALKEAMAHAEQELKKKLKALIKFKDAIGRKFTFPFHLVQTWAGMEELIKQAFMHVEVVGPQVQEGHYDLIGPDGEIILPAVWEKLVQPDWAITMHMWPMERMPQRPMPFMGGPGMPRPPMGFPPRRMGRPPPGGFGPHRYGPPLARQSPRTSESLDQLRAQSSDTESVNSLSTSATRDEEEKKGRFGLGRFIPSKIAKIKLWKRRASSRDVKKTDSRSSLSSLNSSVVSFKSRRK
ncbi:hypothetical protein B0T14DRAFT_605442 [Immersiella caudata]|uniref:Ubiquitin-like domain-containing protein n=1 Tax=Immersiella caudata TaxID=314043 RepID=A0AA39WL00_9PEZI|nr:hypothetical protein B0T14DRAFT_605442 [Immersiella caudata]